MCQWSIKRFDNYKLIKIRMKRVGFGPANADPKLWADSGRHRRIQNRYWNLYVRLFSFAPVTTKALVETLVFVWDRRCSQSIMVSGLSCPNSLLFLVFNFGFEWKIRFFLVFIRCSNGLLLKCVLGFNWVCLSDRLIGVRLKD